MNNLTKTLLGSVALTALAASPAFAAKLHPAMHVSAAHAGGKVVNKTNMHKALLAALADSKWSADGN